VEADTTGLELTMSTSLRSTSLLLTTLCSLSACDPGNDGNFPYCDETIMVIDSLDAALPNGQTAAEVLALVEAEHVLPLEYVQPADDAAVVEIAGGQGSTELTLSFARGEGEVRWIDGEAVYPTGPGPVPAIAIECPSRLEIDGQLGFASADGVFAELFETTVRTELDQDGTLGLARITQTFEPDALLGSFEVVSITPADPSHVDYSIDVGWTLADSYVQDNGPIGQPRGTVGGGAEYQDGETVSYGVFTIAEF
jgi:hypothetical protein